MKQESNIALIFFSRSKTEEAKHKAWFKAQSKNRSLANILIESTSKALEAIQIPTYHFNEKNQEGNTFGERIANAYQTVFDLGYEHVISIGNDCPDLVHIDWQEISASLQKGKSVLGPDTRGGAYLIGLQKSAFNKTEFEGLNWQKNTLFEELRAFCKKQTYTTELKQLRDINSFHDLRIYLKIRKTNKQFVKQIALLLKSSIALFVELKQHIIKSFLFDDAPLRAPPHFAFS